MGGKSIGQDPDANVRLQMRRDAGGEASDLDSIEPFQSGRRSRRPPFPERGTTMKTAAKQYAVTFGLACALALMATPSPLVQTRAGVQGAGTLAQYCAPHTILRTCSASIAAIAAERQQAAPTSGARRNRFKLDRDFAPRICLAA